ncbi:HAMP domain-containing histidine kinase [Bacillus sp. FJAT-29790]|uniref:sensor histidine kinase n=1 Tax=Bacillus sp. FJAT-29790 TaxID=1895002 RepID=UPI001C22D8C0|nr:ATP-binding protein [Bacillus sp. FJAT-29790]MBU8880425.1 HAMP domain-containing histidine kinase [Bacillus sp. FJAT-29790]
MKKGIKRRLVWSNLLLIIVTVALFETIILSGLMYYYQGSIKQTLKDQGAMFSSFYEQELINAPLEDQAEQLLYQYKFLVNVQVQLINQNGNVVAETQKSQQRNILHLNDVKSGLSGTTGYLTSKIEGEKVLSVTHPLIAGGNSLGAIRLTTSMEQLNEVFLKNAVVLLSVGGIVIIIAASLGFFLANTITKPVSQITRAAKEMAAGKFSTRVKKEKDDEIGKLAETLNFMAQQVQQHEQFKNQFIASVSHDLRTPLTSVKGWAVTLHSMTQDQFFKEGLEIITDESDRLNHLVSDLLDLSSLSSGKLSFDFEDIDIAALIHEVVHQFEPRAAGKDISLVTQLGENIGLIRGDRNRLKQVLLNLLDNALKFTSPGGSIRILLEKRVDTVFIHIIDTGIGISKEDLIDVKEKFFKGKTKGSGTGLGLAICEEIMKGHMGEFVLDSEEGKGTTAIISFPL